MKKLSILIIALFTSFFAIAQKAEKPSIKVTGSAEIEIIPDEIFISITLSERYDGKKKIDIEPQEQELKKAISSIGIALNDLKVANLEADYTKVRWSKKDVLASKNYELMVSDAETLGKVFKKLDELNVADAYVSRVSHSKIEEYRKEVKIKAIQAAKEKATYLLEAIDEKVGKPLWITEGRNISLGTINTRINMASNRSISSYADKSDSGITFRKITLRYEITASFEIL